VSFRVWDVRPCATGQPAETYGLRAPDPGRRGRSVASGGRR
jgi:hypothetical protein